MKNWKVKKGHDYRIRARHPWVFSNELLDSPKGILPGEEIELQDMQGHFLARGYGNPHSLISFRAMSFNSKEDFSMQSDFLSARLLQAWKFRFLAGFRKSFRVCFSEADQMPGLILDRYVFTKGNSTYQVFSFQLLTSGMDTAFQKDRHWEGILGALANRALAEGLSEISWENTLILKRNDVNIRKLEALPVESPEVLRTVANESMTDINIEIQNAIDITETLRFNVNLPEGQKTGFFLDQSFNMKLLLGHLQNQQESLKGKRLKILDLCCYMGQWSAQIASNLQRWGIGCEVHLVDVSDLALEKARQNVAEYGAEIFSYKADVLSLADIPAIAQNKFDIVISDPPAFVKTKKDLHPGLHAYTKLNTQAFKLCNPGAVVVSCTCSGAVQLEDFKEALRKAILKSGVKARCVAYGGQGWDHPHLMSFPEGYYLKMVLHQVDPA